MIRLRYVLVAVIVLALVPWALDSLPSLSCLIPTVDCMDESRATTPDEDATRPASAARVIPQPTIVPPGGNAAPSPVAVNAAGRPLAIQEAPAASAARNAPAAASNDESDGSTPGTANVAVDYVIGLAVGDFALGAASGLVSVNWTAAHEAGVVSYALDRKVEGAASYDLNVEVGYPQGDGTTYSLLDDPHGTGTFVYRLRATLTNGTDTILAESGVTL